MPLLPQAGLREDRTGGEAGAAGTIVLGLGNTLLSDDGAGVRAAEALRAAGAGVPCIDGGTLGFRLAETVAEAAACLFVDAAEMHAPPGTVRLLCPEDVTLWRRAHGRGTAHEAGFCDLLDMLAFEDRLPVHWALLAIQPASTGWGEALSPEVADALPEALDLAKEWLNTAGKEGGASDGT